MSSQWERKWSLRETMWWYLVASTERCFRKSTRVIEMSNSNKNLSDVWSGIHRSVASMLESWFTCIQYKLRRRPESLNIQLVPHRHWFIYRESPELFNNHRLLSFRSRSTHTDKSRSTHTDKSEVHTLANQWSLTWKGYLHDMVFQRKYSVTVPHNFSALSSGSLQCHCQV